jgi:hypothetical protein
MFLMKKILFYIFLFLLSINQAFALAGNCGGIGLATINPNVSSMINTADQMVCINTRQLYQCEKMEADLEGDDKKKVIQCDKASLASNNLSDTSLASCVWNGLKISGDNLVNLAKLPGAIAEAAMKGFKETQECNKSLDKKREILNAFNMSISDKRFKLEESFLGNTFKDMSCAELEKMTNARYSNYTNQVMREMMAAKNTGKSYKMPEELMAKNSDLLKNLDSVFKEAGVAYNCYTPKAKAEMICAGVTSLLADIAVGAGFTKAIAAVKAIAKSKKALSSVQSSIAAGEKANLTDAALLKAADRARAGGAVVGRLLTKAEKEAVEAAHQVGLKEGRGFFTYTKEDIANKARILKEAGFSAEERRALMENGITGATSKPASLTFWHEQRIKGELIIQKFTSGGNREKLAEGLAETRKFYKQFLDNKDTNVLFTRNRDGLENVLRANEYGLTSKESSEIFRRTFGGSGKDSAMAYKVSIAVINQRIKEYEQIAKSGKAVPESIEFKIYRAKELRGKLVDDYHTAKYADKYGELDYDKLSSREEALREKWSEDLKRDRAKMQRAKLPVEE